MLKGASNSSFSKLDWKSKNSSTSDQFYWFLLKPVYFKLPLLFISVPCFCSSLAVQYIEYVHDSSLLISLWNIKIEHILSDCQVSVGVKMELAFSILWTFCTSYRKSILANIYLFKVNNKNHRKSCEISSKLTTKTPERRHWRRSVVFIVNFEHNSHLFLVFLLLTLNKWC